MEATKIVLITSGQPSTNPRLVKEADALAESGYNVVVIYQYYSDWATELDKKLLIKKKWVAKQVGGDPHQHQLSYFQSKIRYKISKLISKQFGFKYDLDLLSIGRASLSLIAEAKRVKADLYIAHNLAALPAAVLAARKNHAKCGFDAEDFHRNEVSDSELAFDFRLKKTIENRFLPKVNYITASSEKISYNYKSIYPKLQPLTILNVFSGGAYAPKPMFKGLKLFWFSQTVGEGRGLELVIKAIGELKHLDIELHLLGNTSDETKLSFQQISSDFGIEAERLIFHPPIPPDEIIQFASNFDIGLATETGKPKNRDLCLTNKLFTYLSAGLAIIATDTSAQKAFIEDYPKVGSLYPLGNLEALKHKISTYYTDRTLLRDTQLHAQNLANNTFNWDIEKVKFLTLIKTVLA